MFSFFQIGALEVLSVVVVCIVSGVVGLVRPAVTRWLVAYAIALTIAMICSPADPLSMWLLAVPIYAVFIAGVVLSRRLARRKIET